MNELKNTVSRIIAERFPELQEGSIPSCFEVPADRKLGDLALPCFRFAKALRKAPPAIAADVYALLNERIRELAPVERIELAGGYVNFFFSSVFTLDALKDILKSGDDYGKSDIGNGKTMIIDYSSPNIAKRFHIGHLGTTVIGNSIKKIHAFCGYNCVGINYLGDWGTQYGKLVVAFKLWGNMDDVKERGITELERLYVLFEKNAENDPSLTDRAREEFSKLEKGDEENLRLWKVFKEISLDKYKETYNRLGISFESYDGESFYRDKMQPIVDELKEKGLSKVDDGATIVDLSEYSMPPLMVLKTDGATAYATRDLASAVYRYNTYKFDKSLYVTSAGQSLHFAQLFKVLGMMGYEWSTKMQHVPYGTFSINGEKIASRTGNVVLIDDLFSDAVDKAYEIIEQKNPTLENKHEIAEAVGLGAVIFNALLAGRIKDVNFNWEDAISFEGNTGPYVQYTYARCCSVIAKHGASIGTFDDAVPNEEEANLVSVLSDFPARVLSALEQNEPSVITRYSLELCSAFNLFYHNNNILKSEGATLMLRLALTNAVKNVLGNSLELIGLRRTPVI